VAFVDALDTTGYVGLGGSQNLYTSAAQGAGVMPVAGTLDNLTGYAFAPLGEVTLTLYQNENPTSLSCTLTANVATSTCSASGSVTFAAGDRLTLKVANASNALVRNLGFTATYQTA
jgi:hypothetical protein